MEWKEVLLGELVDIYDSKRIPLTSQEREKIKGDIPYYGAQGIIDYINQFLFDGEYILIAEDGNNIISRQENIAQIAKGKFWVNNHAHILQGKIEQNLLCYIINHTDVSGYVTGSAQPKLNQANLLKIPIKIPVNLSDQRKIAGILSALDSKIENNNKINANLEAQAEALFKSWFVDFTPFKDQPFVDSELGPIPQGWKVGKADDFYKINIGKTPPRKEKEWFSKNESDNKWISISDMGNCGLFISNSAEKLTNAAIKKFNISLVPVNTILLSFKLTIGRVAISDCDLTTNEAIARFILPDEFYLEFSFLMLKLYNYSTLGSTSSIATAVNSKIIKSMKMVMPSLKVLEDFHTITNPLFEKIRFTQKENQRLAALRDTLLPKLMSGEIKL